MKLEVSKKAKGYLTKKGYDPVFGARQLKRLINDQVLDEVAFLIIEKKLGEGDCAVVDLGPKGNLEISVDYAN